MRVFRETAVALVVVVSLFLAGALNAASDGSDEFEFKGIVQSLPDNPDRIGDWGVGGRTVHVTASTRIRQEERPVAVGVLVEVEGFLRSDGSVDATKIKVEDEGGEFEFKGRIESFPIGLIGDWVIGGRTVHVTASTRIEEEDGPVTIGAFAEVEGFLRPDGTVDAAKIEIEDDDDEFKFKGIIESFPIGLIGDWVISGRTVHVTALTRIKLGGGSVAVGAIVEVEGFLRPDGSVDARKIELKSNVGGSRVNFKGTVESLPVSGLIGDWQVSGRTVHVTASTRIKQKHGPVAVEVAVKVKGIRLGDGSILAEMIQVRKSG
ncbi:MAG: DUF5666 domain-containing protein [Acidobacteriota bacterium]